MLKSDSFIFLLGAGASCDAHIPISSDMMKNVEELVISDEKWRKYRDLYYCIKSGIVNAAGIKGIFSPDAVNIETIVNTMEELLKSYGHPLYPFIGSWIPRLTELCGENLINIRELKALILDKLCNVWTKCETSEDYEYYNNFFNFQKEYTFPISIFSLNYDLCLEKSIGEVNIQRGFGFDHIWHWENLDESSTIGEPIILYKLHGSIDWKKTDTGEIKESEKIIPEETAIIFGTAYKLQYIDPFLYLVNVFRKKTLSSNTKGIICIGYSFNDEHINGMLSQALKKDENKKIISVAPVINEAEERNRIKKINEEIANRIQFIPEKAKAWLGSLNCKIIEDLLGENDDPF